VLLELRALLDYQEFYLLQMDMAASFSVNAGIMGAFTNDLVKCDTLFHFGIPVWLIRPYTELSFIRVKALTQIQFASGTIPLDPPSSSLLSRIYVGPAGCLEKYIAIANYVSQLLQFPDPLVPFEPYLLPILLCLQLMPLTALVPNLNGLLHVMPLILPLFCNN
jgi:hypothetical protein